MGVAGDLQLFHTVLLQTWFVSDDLQKISRGVVSRIAVRREMDPTLFPMALVQQSRGDQAIPRSAGTTTGGTNQASIIFST